MHAVDFGNALRRSIFSTRANERRSEAFWAARLETRWAVVVENATEISLKDAASELCPRLALVLC